MVVLQPGLLRVDSAFAEFRKATVSFGMSLRPSAWNNSAPTGQILMKFDIRVFLEKCRENQRLLYALFWVISRRLNFYMSKFRNPLFRFHRRIRIRLWRWNRQCVSKRRHIKFRRPGITQKKAYNIQNTAKVWNQQIKDLLKSHKNNGYFTWIHFW
jgi:hypothetical protein